MDNAFEIERATRSQAKEQRMRARKSTPVGLVLAAVLLLAACGAPETTDTVERTPEQPEQVDPPDEAREETSTTIDREERPGRDTNLPIYPDAVRIRFHELGDTGFVVAYVSESSLDEVIAFYVEEIGDMDGVFHSEYSHGDGDYEFIFEDWDSQLPDHPEQHPAFHLTLWDRGGTTEIQVMGSLNFFE